MTYNRWRSSVSAAGTLLALAALVLAPAVALAQTGTVEGRVTAVGGGPIAGAQVTVEGTNLGTRTDEDGRFTLLVPAGTQTIRVLAIGYRVGTLQIRVVPGQTTTANLELNRSVLRLDEVVVTGTAGETRRRELGSSVAQINLAAQVEEVPANVEQLLQARAAGLTVMQTAGSAGAGAQIRLRGAVSVSQSNQPIIYIDGIRIRSEGYARNAPAPGADFTGRSGNIQASPLNDINPADIERIEIIKGAAAATLYGTEASAGVIQIFTKKGARGRPRWNVEVNQGFAQVRPFGTDWNPFLNFKPADSITVVNGQIQVVEKRKVTDGQCHPNPKPRARCSWLRNGYMQGYKGSVTGGFDQFQYFVSGSWDHNQGVLPQDEEKKLVTRANFSFDLSEKLRLDVNNSYTNFRIRNTPSGNNAQGLTLNVYRAERNYRSSSDPAVLDSLLNQRITTEIDRLITGATVYYNPLPWFTNRFTIGYDFANQENRNLRPFGFVSQPLGILFDEQNKYSTLTADYAGNIDYRLTGALSGTFSFGGQSIANQRIRTHAFGRDFAGPGEPTVTGASRYIANESRLRVINAGFFFQNVFKLSDRYFLTGGVRFDGNSAFGEALGIQAYPKASFSYVISEEPFWPQGLGEVKLRAAVGWAGRAPGAFDKLRTWSPIPVGGQPGFTPDNLGDTLIGPERTREIEVGFDAGLFNNRLAAEFTWYHRLTTDALMEVVQIPSLGGWDPQAANVGTLQNKGFELTVNATLIDAPNFGLELGGSVFSNKSLVKDLGGAPPFFVGDGWVEEGFPILAAAGKIIKNKDQIAPPDTICTENCSKALTNTYIFGPTLPEWIYGMTASIRLPRGITLSARGELQLGAYIYDGASGNALSRSVRWPTCARAHGILDQGGTVDQLTAWERIACIPANHDFDIHWYKQDFFKLRDLTLNIPVSWAIRAVDQATLTISVNNYFKWVNDDLRLFDPEMTQRNGVDEQVRSIGEHVPPPATIMASLRLSF
ncbi:TonB-dependent receptor SusC [bacterium HR33]|nr:TonB-dependent receptor SusC [bacterium HR33]